MKIIPLDPGNSNHIGQAANLLLNGFQGAWPTLGEAMEEVKGSLQAGRISLLAVAEGETVPGWIGGQPQYDGCVWELHPLVVDENHRGRGIGRALVCALEQKAAARGGITMILGTDDEDGRTSLGDVDIYQDFYDKVKNIVSLGKHPFEFYKKLGYMIVGAIPDANGWGKPDILMAKRLKAVEDIYPEHP